MSKCHSAPRCTPPGPRSPSAPGTRPQGPQRATRWTKEKPSRFQQLPAQSSRPCPPAWSAALRESPFGAGLIDLRADGQCRWKGRVKIGVPFSCVLKTTPPARRRNHPTPPRRKSSRILDFFDPDDGGADKALDVPAIPWNPGVNHSARRRKTLAQTAASAACGQCHRNRRIGMGHCDILSRRDIVMIGDGRPCSRHAALAQSRPRPVRRTRRRRAAAAALTPRPRRGPSRGTRRSSGQIRRAARSVRDGACPAQFPAALRAFPQRCPGSSAA